MTSPDQTGTSSNMPPTELKNTVSRNSATRSHSGSTARTPRWWKIRLFKGMIGDLRRRAPYYWSDWKDAWDYRVVPATVYMYFAKYDAPLYLHGHVEFHAYQISQDTASGSFYKSPAPQPSQTAFAAART